ncbi:MAG: hypothetical protein HKN41_08300 [Ilumatobacter sp.]|nr:hypothetical protein [Ilumatobacter sp.]
MRSDVEGSSFSASDRRALASIAMQFFLNGAAFASIVPRLPEIRERLEVGLDGLGLLLSLGLVVGTVGGWRSPSIIQRWGSRRALTVGAAVLIAGLPVVGIATAPVVFVVAFGAMAFADGIVDVAMNLQGSALSARRHAPVMNRLHGLWSLGTVAGGLVAAQAAASGISLRLHLAGVAAVLAAGLWFVGRGLLDDASLSRPGDAAAPEPAGARQVVARLPLVFLALAGAAAITVELVSSDWAAFRLSEDFGAAPGFAGLGFVAFTFGMTTGRLAGDAIAVRLGDDRLFDVSVTLVGFGLVGAAFLPNRWLVLVAYVVAGLGNATLFPKLYDDAAKVGRRPGVGLAWLRTGSSLTALAIPTLVGVLASTALSVGSATAIVTLPCVLALLVLSSRSRAQPAARSGYRSA